MFNQPDPLDPRTPAYSPNAETVPMGSRGNVVETTRNGSVEGESRSESYVDPAGYQTENRVETYEDKNARRTNLRYWVVSIIYFLLGLLEVILGLRFIFRLLGANDSNDFIKALYNFSHVFVGPFNNIFNDQTIGSRSIFELSTLISMLIYALICWGLVSLVRVLLAPTYGTGQRVVRTLRRS